MAGHVEFVETMVDEDLWPGLTLEFENIDEKDGEAFSQLMKMVRSRS